MSDDIVKRLHCEAEITGRKTPLEAADEIERLRSELEKLSDPSAVHVSILHGKIALTKEQARHIAGVDQEIERLRAWKEKVIDQARRDEDSICQDLGRALGFPWFKDDPVNFPNATEADGVCVGEHVAATLAKMAADKITALRAEIAAKDAALLAVKNALAKDVCEDDDLIVIQRILDEALDALKGET
jgi:hypothetical protein